MELYFYVLLAIMLTAATLGVLFGLCIIFWNATADIREAAYEARERKRMIRERLKEEKEQKGEKKDASTL